jgi:hypothetical protein
MTKAEEMLCNTVDVLYHKEGFTKYHCADIIKETSSEGLFLQSIAKLMEDYALLREQAAWEAAREGEPILG